MMIRAILQAQILFIFIILRIANAADTDFHIILATLADRINFSLKIRCPDGACDEWKGTIEKPKQKKKVPWLCFTILLGPVVKKDKHLHQLDIELTSLSKMGNQTRTFKWDTIFHSENAYVLYLGEFSPSKDFGPIVRLFLRGKLTTKLPELDDQIHNRYHMTLQNKPTFLSNVKEIFSQLFVTNENRTSWKTDEFHLRLNRMGMAYVRETPKPSMILKIEKLFVIECSICGDLLKHDMLPQKLKKCDHFLHIACFSKRLRKGNKTCPNCHGEIELQMEQKIEDLFTPVKAQKFLKFDIKQPVLQNGDGGVLFVYNFLLNEMEPMSNKKTILAPQSLKMILNTENAKDKLNNEIDELPEYAATADLPENVFPQQSPDIISPQNEPEMWGNNENNGRNVEFDFVDANDYNNFYNNNDIADTIAEFGAFFSDFATASGANLMSPQQQQPQQQPQPRQSPNSRSPQPHKYLPQRRNGDDVNNFPNISPKPKAPRAVKSVKQPQKQQEMHSQDYLTDYEITLMSEFESTGDFRVLDKMKPEKRKMIINFVNDVVESDEQILERFATSTDNDLSMLERLKDHRVKATVEKMLAQMDLEEFKNQIGIEIAKSRSVKANSAPNQKKTPTKKSVGIQIKEPKPPTLQPNSSANMAPQNRNKDKMIKVETSEGSDTDYVPLNRANSSQLRESPIDNVPTKSANPKQGHQNYGGHTRRNSANFEKPANDDSDNGPTKSANSYGNDNIDKAPTKSANSKQGHQNYGGHTRRNSANFEQGANDYNDNGPTKGANFYGNDNIDKAPTKSANPKQGHQNYGGHTRRSFEQGANDYSDNVPTKSANFKQRHKSKSASEPNYFNAAYHNDDIDDDNPVDQEDEHVIRHEWNNGERQKQKKKKEKGLRPPIANNSSQNSENETEFERFLHTQSPKQLKKLTAKIKVELSENSDLEKNKANESELMERIEAKLKKLQENSGGKAVKTKPPRSSKKIYDDDDTEYEYVDKNKKGKNKMISADF